MTKGNSAPHYILTTTHLEKNRIQIYLAIDLGRLGMFWTTRIGQQISQLTTIISNTISEQTVALNTGQEHQVKQYHLTQRIKILFLFKELDECQNE